MTKANKPESRKSGANPPKAAEVKTPGGQQTQVNKDQPAAGIFALAVFADDDPVQPPFFGVLLARRERRRDACEDARRPHVGVLLKGLADGEPEAPERDVVGD